MALNESFENIKNIAADAAQTAAKKAKTLAFITKANISIRAEQEKQRKAYTELGKLYYRDFVTGEEPDEAEYLPWTDKISESVKEVARLKEDIERVKAESDEASIVTDEELVTVDEEAVDAEAEAAEAEETAPAEETPAEEAPTEEPVE